MLKAIIKGMITKYIIIIEITSISQANFLLLKGLKTVIHFEILFLKF